MGQAEALHFDPSLHPLLLAAVGRALGLLTVDRGRARRHATFPNRLPFPAIQAATSKPSTAH